MLRGKFITLNACIRLKKINEPDIQFKKLKKGGSKTKERRKGDEIKIKIEYGEIENNNKNNSDVHLNQSWFFSVD